MEIHALIHSWNNVVDILYTLLPILDIRREKIQYRNVIHTTVLD